PDRLPRVVRRRVGVVVAGARGLPGGHERGSGGPCPQEGANVGGRVGDDVERREVEPILGRGRDPGLVLAVEREGLVRDRLRVVVRQSSGAQAAEREGGAAGACSEQQLPPAEVRAVAHPVVVAAVVVVAAAPTTILPTCESGSASASIAWES